MVILPILLTIVITLIADLDHPQRGLIKVSQQSMVDLQKTLKKY
jgi:ABC-type molybdate transport system ATPase subunit